MIRLDFPGNGRAFSGYRDACTFCLDAGISYGSMEAGNPCALWWGRAALDKWSRLAKGSLLDGKMEGDFRDGQVRIEISDPRKAKEVPPGAPINQARGVDLRRSADFLDNFEFNRRQELAALSKVVEAGGTSPEQVARVEALRAWLSPEGGE